MFMLTRELGPEGYWPSWRSRRAGGTSRLALQGEPTSADRDAALLAMAVLSISASLASCSAFPSRGEEMAIERTFSIIKPDASARNLTGAINALIEKAGLRIVAQKRIRMTREHAETFYAVHRERPFFRELVEFMISGPVVVQVLEGDNAIARYRDIMGATNPANAADGTIRKLYAKSVGENSVHGSDAPDTAEKEIAQFFSGNEIIP
jgi:nucleoside-diphosphate kinase